MPPIDGRTLMPVEQVAVPIVFLGRDERGAPAEPIANPFFFQIERSNTVDASVGVHWRFAETAVVPASALVPINHQGAARRCHPNARGRVDILR